MSTNHHRIVRQGVIIVGWLITALVTGDVIDAATSNLSGTGRSIVGGVAWAGWLVVLVAALVRLPVSLTVLRLGSTAGTFWGFVGALIADGDTTETVAAVTAPLVVAVVALTPLIGQAWVDGAAYGDEARFCLRAPVPLLVGPVPLAWAAVVAGVGVGPVLLANERWGVGAVAAAAGAALVATGGRALHGLSRRWLVLVPAGVVVHDRMATREPFLMIKATVLAIGPAAADIDTAGDDCLDVTLDASGPVVEIALSKVVEVVPRPARGGTAAVRRVRSVLVVPSRPVDFVATARHRGLG